MQAKIIDFASDAITKQLQKIDKDDVKKIMANVTGSKVQTKPLPTSSSIKIDDTKKVNRVASVTSSEEYCALVQNEFNFSSPSSSNNQKKSDLNFTKSDEGSLKKNGMILDFELMTCSCAF